MTKLELDFNAEERVSFEKKMLDLLDVCEEEKKNKIFGIKPFAQRILDDINDILFKRTMIMADTERRNPKDKGDNNSGFVTVSVK